jgi:hypothetical protein
MTSVLNVDEIAAKDGTSPVELTKQSAAKAWLNLNGTGTIAARDSFNISSTSDISTGIYTATVTNSFSDANFVYSIASGWTSGGQGVHQEVHEDRITSSVLGLGTMNTSNAAADSANIFSSAHGDLA